MLTPPNPPLPLLQAIMLSSGIGVSQTSASDSAKHCKTALALVTGALSRAPPPSLAAAERAWERLRTTGDPQAVLLDFARAAYAGSEVAEWNAGFFAASVVPPDSLLFAEPAAVDDALRSALAREEAAATAVAGGGGGGGEGGARFLTALWPQGGDSAPLVSRPKQTYAEVPTVAASTLPDGSVTPEVFTEDTVMTDVAEAGTVNADGAVEAETVNADGAVEAGTVNADDTAEVARADSAPAAQSLTATPTPAAAASPTPYHAPPLLSFAGSVVCAFEASARASGAALRAILQGLGVPESTRACPLTTFTASLFFTDPAAPFPTSYTARVPSSQPTSARALATSFFARSAALGNGHASVRATDASSPAAAATLRGACAAHVPTACFALARSLERSDAHLAKRFYDLAVEETRVTSGNAAAVVRAVQRPVALAIWRLRSRRSLLWLHSALLAPALDVTATIARAIAPSHAPRIDAALTRAREFLVDALALPPAGSSDAVNAGLDALPPPSASPSTTPGPTPRDAGAAALDKVRESIRKTERARAAERAKVSFAGWIIQSVETGARAVREGVREGMRRALLAAESVAAWETTSFIWAMFVVCVVVLLMIARRAF